MVAINKLIISSSLVLGGMASHVMLTPYDNVDCQGMTSDHTLHAREGKCCKPHNPFKSFRIGMPEGTAEYDRLISAPCMLYLYDRKDCKKTQPDNFIGPGLTKLPHDNCHNVNWTAQHLSSRPARAARLHCPAPPLPEEALITIINDVTETETVTKPAVIKPAVTKIVTKPASTVTKLSISTTSDLIFVPIITTISAPIVATSCTTKKVALTATVDTTTTVWMAPTTSAYGFNQSALASSASELDLEAQSVSRHLVTRSPKKCSKAWCRLNERRCHIECKPTTHTSTALMFSSGSVSQPTATFVATITKRDVATAQPIVECFQNIDGAWTSTTCAPAHTTA